MKNRSNHFEIHLELKNSQYLQDFITTIRRLDLSIDDIDVIQLEINGKYRDYYNIDNLKIIINALSKFIKQYDEYIKRR